ncbi:MAG: YbaB/EbfC family nucleoid-associated protein [Alphaproteobacteria bacterium]|nr:YbaB/EbfC family nucleoid-associated protein [Alphaproteobacteria bacterium]MBO7642381.1 YbaB/EbfC family nucleoid-associated protein [Alphaproteobacteria bacterium]
MNNFSDLMKQAQKMQKQLMDAQKKVEEMSVEGASGGGMVSIKMNGKYEIQSLVIDPKLMTPEDATMVSDLVIAAYNDAKKKVEEQISSGMSGILPPGMKLPF